MHFNTSLWGFGSNKRGITLGCIAQGMSRAGSSADDEKPDDEKIHVCKRIRSSAFETSQTPLLNDVPRPVRCAVCKKELGAKGEGEETIEALMISHLHRAGFKTKLHLHPAAGRTSFCIAEPKYYHIVCREHGELHQQQKNVVAKEVPQTWTSRPNEGAGEYLNLGTALHQHWFINVGMCAVTKKIRVYVHASCAHWLICHWYSLTWLVIICVAWSTCIAWCVHTCFVAVQQGEHSIIFRVVCFAVQSHYTCILQGSMKCLWYRQLGATYGSDLGPWVGISE